MVQSYRAPAFYLMLDSYIYFCIHPFQSSITISPSSEFHVKREDEAIQLLLGVTQVDIEVDPVPGFPAQLHTFVLYECKKPGMQIKVIMWLAHSVSTSPC